MSPPLDLDETGKEDAFHANRLANDTIFPENPFFDPCSPPTTVADLVDQIARVFDC